MTPEPQPHPLWDTCDDKGNDMDLDLDFMHERGDQEAAFDNCIEFLKRVKRTKKASKTTLNHSGYFKHLVESPFRNLSGQFAWGLKRDHRCGRLPDIKKLDIYTGYVYKGTFNMAAKSMGFIHNIDPYYPHSLNVEWNVSMRGLDEAILDYIKYMIKKQNNIYYY